MKRKRSLVHGHFLFGITLLTSLLILGNRPIILAQSTRPAIRFDPLTRRIQTIMKQEKTPGVQVLVFTKDSLLYKLNAGVMDLKTKAPITDQSMFRLGSITKSFVATSALMLVEKKRLSLSEELKKAAPEIQFSNPWEATDPVRIGHLLEHTTGFDDIALKVFAINDPNITLQKGLDTAAASRHSRWRPGTFMAYSNSGPTVVARIIEKRTGQEFESYVRQHIFGPMGMKTSTFRRNGAALTRLVTNYLGGNEPQEKPYEHLVDRPSGSLNAPALELMPFVQMLLNRGTYRGVRLLDASSVNRMEKPAASLAAKAGLTEGYGLCNYTTSYKGYIFHGHDGWVTGCQALYLYNTELDLGLIVLVNSAGAGFSRINSAVLEVALKNSPARVPPAYTLTKAEKESLLGFYRDSYVRFGFNHWYEWLTGISRIFEQDGQLLMKPSLGSDAISLRPVSPTRFILQSKTEYNTVWALVQDDDKERVITNNNDRTMTATNAIGAWLPLILTGFSLLMATIVSLAGLLWLIRYGWLKRREKMLSIMSVRMPLWGYALSFLGSLGTYLSVISTDPFSLGVVGTASVVIFLTSLLTAVLAIWAFINLIRYQRQIPNWVDRTFLWVAVCSSLLVVGYMAVWGLIGLRLWT